MRSRSCRRCIARWSRRGRSGQLPIALEGLARFVRGYSEARTAIGLALWYPLVVLTLAYALFVGLVISIVPRSQRVRVTWACLCPTPMRWLGALGESTEYWWLAGPID